MQYLKKAFQLFYTLCFTLFTLFYPSNSIMSAETTSWIEASSDSDGIQFIDKESVKYKNGILFVMTKYSELNGDTQEAINSISYQLEIDCASRMFKKESRKNWEMPEGKLMKQTIIKSCSY